MPRPARPICLQNMYPSLARAPPLSEPRQVLSRHLSELCPTLPFVDTLVVVSVQFCDLGVALARGGGMWAAKTIKRPQQKAAQPQHTNRWAPRARKRHQQEHRPQRPTESSSPTQHAKGRTGDRPGPAKKQQPDGMSHRGAASSSTVLSVPGDATLFCDDKGMPRPTLSLVSALPNM